MKILILALFLILSVNLLAQNPVAAHYRNHFFSDIQLYANGTFEYNWYHHFYGSWTKGRWWSRADTVYFRVILMYDTLSIIKNNGMSADSLVLSKYSNARRITPQQLTEVTLHSIEQNRIAIPDKMVFKENKLYEIKDGRLVTEKRIVIKRGSESDPWYFKSDQ